MIEKLQRLVVIAAIVIVLGIGVSAWLQWRADSAKMNAVIEAQQTLIVHAVQERQQAQVTLDAKLKELEELRNSVKTPRQAACQMPTVIPGVSPVEIPVSPKSEQATASEAKTPPDAAVTYKLTGGEIQTLLGFGIDCQECKANLTKAEVDREALTEQLTATEKQRDAAVKTAKGGGLWTRFKRNGKWFIVGTVAGGAAVAVARR